MRTRMFVVALFWWFHYLRVCPFGQEQTRAQKELRDDPTLATDAVLHQWYFPNRRRPPPLAA
jgi:hypothetical protein